MKTTRQGRAARMRIGRLAAAILVMTALPAGADDALETKQLVEKARFTLENFAADDFMGPFRDIVRQARGVLIVPQFLKAAFVVGASGGSGVFLDRTAAGDQWSGPAFYTLGEVSVGFQAGAEASEVVLVAMTERGVTAMLGDNVKLGADVGIAVGPFGGGAAGQTANLSADILAFSRSKGLYGGISLQGAVVKVRHGWNRAYYGRDVTPRDILLERRVSNPHASGLIAELGRLTAAP